MGYDLHVTRARDWRRSVEHQITDAEWRDQVTWDPDLRPDAANGPHSALWVDSAGAVRGWFDWYDGAVFTTNPDRAVVGKLLDLAARLKARVQGDQGEFYESAEDWQQAG